MIGQLEQQNTSLQALVDETEARNTNLQKDISTLRQSSKSEASVLREKLEDMEEQHKREIQTLKNTLASRSSAISDQRTKLEVAAEDVERMRNEHSLAMHSLKTSTSREIAGLKQKYESVCTDLNRATAELDNYRAQATARERESSRSAREANELGRKLRSQVFFDSLIFRLTLSWRSQLQTEKCLTMLSLEDLRLFHSNPCQDIFASKIHQNFDLLPHLQLSDSPCTMMKSGNYAP